MWRAYLGGVVTGCYGVFVDTPLELVSNRNMYRCWQGLGMYNTIVRFGNVPFGYYDFSAVGSRRGAVVNGYFGNSGVAIFMFYKVGRNRGSGTGARPRFGKGKWVF